MERELYEQDYIRIRRRMLTQADLRVAFLLTMAGMIVISLMV
jgi:hypothetical protein